MIVHLTIIFISYMITIYAGVSPQPSKLEKG